MNNVYDGKKQLSNEKLLKAIYANQIYNLYIYYQQKKCVFLLP